MSLCHSCGTVTERDVYTYYWALKNKPIETQAALATLVSAGRGKWGEKKGERGPATREFQLLPTPTPTSAGLGVSPSKTPKPADADVPSMQKITSSDEPKKEPVSDEVKFQTLPASASAGFSNYPGKMPKPADTEAPKSQENAPSREENEPPSDPITEPVSDGPEFQLLQESEVPPEPSVSGDLSL
jgi:hypothetical protein